MTLWEKIDSLKLNSTLSSSNPCNMPSFTTRLLLFGVITVITAFENVEYFEGDCENPEARQFYSGPKAQDDISQTESFTDENVPFPYSKTPGLASAFLVGSNEAALRNDILLMRWRLTSSSESIPGGPELTHINNYLDEKVDVLEGGGFLVTLFSGETISEKNCVALEPWEIGRIDGDKMSSKLEEQYDGMYIKVTLLHNESKMKIIWKAVLRNDCNFVRVYVELVPQKQEVNMTDVCLFHALDVSPSLQASSRPKWDNRKKDAVPGGVVALSPTIFVGIEHPSAANGAGERSIQLGTVSAHELNSGDNKEEMKTASFDVTTKINSGHVVHAYFDNWHNSASLSLYGAEILENDIVWKTSLSRGKVSKDVATGNIYSFNIKGTTPGARYTIRFKYKGSGKFEHPATVGLNIHPHPRKIICCLDVNDRVAVDSPRQASLVLGVSPIGQMRRAFLYYIERTRSHPSRMHLHYNSWYDIGTGQSYNESDVLQVMRSF
eukprot:m.115033 g.115033  ORF g.115033 m.115033 type:complete len:494 (-) comp14188_c0_seq3:3228-4709(-)